MTRRIWFVLVCVATAILLSPAPSPAADPGAAPADVQNLLKVNKDDRILGNGRPGPVTERLHDAYWSFRHEGWCAEPIDYAQAEAAE